MLAIVWKGEGGWYCLRLLPYNSNISNFGQQMSAALHYLKLLTYIKIILILNNKCLLLCTALSYLPILQFILIMNNKCHHTQIF